MRVVNVILTIFVPQAPRIAFDDVSRRGRFLEVCTEVESKRRRVQCKNRDLIGLENKTLWEVRGEQQGDDPYAWLLKLASGSANPVPGRS